MTKNPKRTQINMRLSTDDYQLLKKAASIHGVTLTDYLKGPALKIASASVEIVEGAIENAVKGVSGGKDG